MNRDKLSVKISRYRHEFGRTDFEELDSSLVETLKSIFETIVPEKDKKTKFYSEILLALYEETDSSIIDGMERAKVGKDYIEYAHGIIFGMYERINAQPAGYRNGLTQARFNISPRTTRSNIDRTISLTGRI